MTSSDRDFQHLVALIKAARAEAERLGSGAEPVIGALDEAERSAQALLADDGRPDEGVRPNNLTTENDE